MTDILQLPGWEPTKTYEQGKERVTDGSTGVTSFVTDVPCKQEGDAYGHYRWMEYQLKQAETPAAPAKPL